MHRLAVLSVVGLVVVVAEFIQEHGLWAAAPPAAPPENPARTLLPAATAAISKVWRDDPGLCDAGNITNIPADLEALVSAAFDACSGGTLAQWGRPADSDGLYLARLPTAGGNCMELQVSQQVHGSYGASDQCCVAGPHQGTQKS